MNIMLLGAPGSGKGTLAEKLINYQGFKQLSTGDLMRKEMANRTSLGIECEKFINEGKLVPDEVTNGIVRNFLQTDHDHLIFDGYPRTINQAVALEAMLKELNSSIAKTVFIDVPQTILLERISGRLICPTCKVSYHETNRQPKVKGICDNDQTVLVKRPDDVPEKVEVRLAAYAKETAPLVDFFINKPGFIHIEDHNQQSPEQIYQSVMEKM